MYMIKIRKKQKKISLENGLITINHVSRVNKKFRWRKVMLKVARKVTTDNARSKIASRTYTGKHLIRLDYSTQTRFGSNVSVKRRRVAAIEKQ